MTLRLNYSQGPRVFREETDLGPKFPARRSERVASSGEIEFHQLDVGRRLREGRWPSSALLRLKRIAVADTPERSPSFLTDGDDGAYDFLLALMPEPERRPRVVGLLVLDLLPVWTCTYDFGERRVTAPAAWAPEDSARAEFLWVPKSHRRTGVATTLLRTACSDGRPLLLHRSFTRTAIDFACSVFGQQVPIFHREASLVANPRSPYFPEPPNDVARN